MSFRSLPRPSSSLNAKASTVCPYLLDLRASRTAIRAPDFVAPQKSRRSRLRLRLPPLSPVRLALHENLLARGAAFRCAPVFACSVILDVLNPKMFVKTGVFRHSFFMSFLLLCSFQRAFCFGFFPNHFAVPRNVRPRRCTTRSSLFFVTSRPSEKILRKKPSGIFIPSG